MIASEQTSCVKIVSVPELLILWDQQRIKELSHVPGLGEEILDQPEPPVF